MNQLTNMQTEMSSREIAELTGKQHKNVKRDIESMVKELGEDKLKFERIYFDSMNRKQKEYALDQDMTLCLTAGYSAVQRMAIIKRWKALEENKHQMPPWYNSLSIEARIAIEDLQKQRDEAVATKAEIGHRREATAMNTASQAVKKANKLEIELDKSKEYCTIKRMEMICHGQKFKWRDLKSASIEMKLLPIDVFDANYGTVKAYHKDVWLEVYAIEF